MKRLIIFTLLAVSVNLQSAPVDSTKAILIAERFSEFNNLKKSVCVSSYATIIHSDVLLAYVFPLFNSGFIVVSADDRLTPVISYSDNGIWEKNSPLDQIVKTDLSLRLKHYDYQSIDSKHKVQDQWQYLVNSSKNNKIYEQWPPEGTTSTGGWTVTHWNQSAPYNIFCPIKLSTNQRSVVGCPATAMAQILHFHHQLNGTRFGIPDRYYHQYTQNFWIDDAWSTYKFLSFDSLNVYMDSIELKYATSTELNMEEIAALSLAAGFACKSVYDPAGSGTFGVNQAFAAYKKFGFNDAVLLDSDYSDEEIRQKMIINIKNALPVHLATVDQNWYYGHNVVCDGYRDNGFFRLNMGWGGSYDNWYSLPEGFPLSLTVFEGIVADINAVTITEYALTLLASPNDIGIELNGAGSYTEGTSVAITACEINGYAFTQWSGEENDLALVEDIYALSTTITMPNRAVTLTAVFEPIPTYSITFIVKDMSQTPIEGATINIIDPENTLLTDNNGEAFIDLPNGTFGFTVSANNFYLYEGIIVVESENETINIYLIQLGVNDNSQSIINIFPNPFKEYIFIDNLMGIKRLAITSVFGQIIKEFELNNINVNYLQICDLQNGIYVLIIDTFCGQRISKRIVKY
jgi:hypothetical protein